MALADYINSKPTKSFHLGIAQKDSNEDMEREGQFLAQKTASDNEIEIVAFVDGKVAGTAGIDAVSTKYKVRHRPGFDGGVHSVRQGGRLYPTGINRGGGERKSHRAI